MAGDIPSRAAHRFFVEHLNSFEPFTKADVIAVTGWSADGADAYWSKQFKNILEPAGDHQYRMRDRFRAYLDWKDFKHLVTQVKTSRPSYAPILFDEVVVYEFYVPLAHKAPLKVTLDALSYKDVILARFRHRIGVEHLKGFFEYLPTDTDDTFLERICTFVEGKFGGYSMYHVAGRFRAGKLLTQEDASDARKSSKYFVDETTAVTRFVFPCLEGEADKVRFLFKALFMDPITERVSGEHEIWVVESGTRNKVQVWKPELP
jgi:hypothetical protein